MRTHLRFVGSGAMIMLNKDITISMKDHRTYSFIDVQYFDISSISRFNFSSE